MNRYLIFSSLLFFLYAKTCFSQNTGFGNLGVDDFLRTKNLNSGISENMSWILRNFSNSPESFFFNSDSVSTVTKKIDFKLLPIYFNFRMDGERPYVGGEYGMIPARGGHSFLSTGIKLKYSFIQLQLQPEIVYAQNLPFDGFPNNFSSDITLNRFLYWDIGDNPERFGNSSYRRFYLGQSNISFIFGSFEFGVGTKNYWWGPGQWNSLIFSNNSPGFPNISLNTLKPAKTFLGNFEGQLLVGRLESSQHLPSQYSDLNSIYFTGLNKNWRYLNAIMIGYTPKWIPSLIFGYARTYQYYNQTRPRDLKGWLPILEPMVKEKLFTNGNSVIYDDRAQSQQISIFGQYKMSKAKAEVYFQYGRLDHAQNWREFFLNPEYARAYQVGFIKLSNLPSTDKLLKIRGEITHQQESVNRYLRTGLDGGLTWHTHGQVRGFTNYGQPMGVGIGTGSNVQTLEFSIVEDWNKWGVLFERLENNQDFYFRAFGQQGERKPWIDWSTSLLWNTSFKDLFISARMQGIYARNYQWGLSETSTPEFPVSQNLLSLHSQVNVIYFWNRSLKNVKDVKRRPSAGRLNVN